MPLSKRIRRLRTLVAQLERLPASALRERALMDARTRISDLQTGQPTEAMRGYDVDKPPLEGSRSRPRAPTRRAVPQRPPPPVTSSEQQSPPPAAPAPPRRNGEGLRAVEPDRRLTALGTDDVIWLDDQNEGSDERDDGAGPAPWRRGLRG